MDFKSFESNLSKIENKGTINDYKFESELEKLERSKNSKYVRSSNK